MLDLPTDFPRPAVTRHHRDRRSISLSATLLESLRGLAAERAARLEEVLLAAFHALLGRYTAQDDTVLGVRHSQLRRDGVLVVRTIFEGDPAIREAVTRASNALEAARLHGAVTTAELAEALGRDGDRSRHPAFQAAFVVDGTAEAIGPLDVALELHLPEVSLRYDAELFRPKTIDRMLGHYRVLLESFAADPARRLSHVMLVTEDERRQLTEEWPQTRTPFPSEACLHHLFESRVDRQPDAPAAIHEGRTITYAELERRSNQLAHHLRRLGVGPDRPVGLCVERSVEMVVGLLGISKAGGGYVPISPSYPPERISFMTDDAGVGVMLTQERLAERLGPAGSPHLVRLDSEWEVVSRESRARPEGGAGPENLAYLIYTSGSTGRPKGVMLDHRGRVNNFCDFNTRFAVGPGDRLIALSSLSFDMTAYDVFGTLAAGATIVLPLAEEEKEPDHWARLMVGERVTVWHSAPAMLEMLMTHVEAKPDLSPRHLRLVLLGGDWIPVTLPDRVKRVAARGCRVVSMGGATEVSMDSTIYEIERTDPSWRSIPYGRPMANQTAYVLNARRQLVPVGVPGELYLGGVGVGWGYFDRPALTAEKFVPHPFSAEPGDRLYRTGDLARFMPDGNLELLGRMDFQVKIRGHRIELGEIGSTLGRHPAVQEAVVVARADGGEKRLVAYVVPRLQGEGADGLASSEEEQVSQWQKVYEETYSQASDQDDPTFDIIGWNSSCTGLPIPDEEMREWVETTVERILEMRPRRVLEIGCGTGLMLFRIAPHCERYVGLDFSRVAVDKIRRIAAERGLSRVEVMQSSADDLAGIADHAFDAVVLNSITQLFPSVDYLRRVLEGAVRVVEPGGFVFVGDNRSLPHFRMLHASIQLFQSPGSVTREQLAARIAQSMAQEEQLVLDPDFFGALATGLPQVSRVLVQMKRGWIVNELSQFRYDVILGVGLAIDDPEPTSVVDWGSEGLTVEALRARLAEERPRSLRVNGVPNARLAKETKALALIDGGGTESVEEIRRETRRRPAASAVDPEDVFALGDTLPYRVHVGWSRSGGPGSFDALLIRKSGGEERPSIPAFPDREVRVKPWGRYANQPLRSKLSAKLPSKLRKFLQAELPDYMVPSAFVILESLPLNPNGKIDRRALPPPSRERPELGTSDLLPRDALERVVADIWAEVLGLDRVGVGDNFLDLGGHSLLATQVQSRVLELFPVELPLRHFLSSPTVASLAERLREAARDAAVDVDEIARMVVEYSELSPEQASAALESEHPAPRTGKNIND